ncbi:MAG: PIN domain-containing protein [Candidatus Woesebacteria bacterium]|nr:PIN domain-containing protein [Candidatus Woesebacteria bacterium]
MIFIDTNYFLRFLLSDVDLQFKEVKEFFLQASDGKFKTFTSTIVIFEVYWVILGQFKRDKQKVIQVLNKLLNFQFIEIENHDLIIKAIDIYKKSNLGLVDCYNVAYAKSKKAIDFKTFDKDLIKKLLKEEK